MTLEYLQDYWWMIISILGALLVFLLFVQGGQSMILGMKNESDRELIVNAMGRKWELTFTTLVTFGGAFFAAFPLFYSTSFGGAYWLWILILFSFILQAVSYEYRRKKGNIYGTNTYDIFLAINGLMGCVLLGVAVSMMFFGGEFTVTRGNILDSSSPVISHWVATRGLEAICDWHNLVLGVAVFFLARTLACLYLINATIHDSNFEAQLRQQTLFNGGIFVIFFLWFLGVLFTSSGYNVVTTETGQIVTLEANKYLNNYLHLIWPLVALVTGVILVLTGLSATIFSSTYKKGIWWAGLGTILAVLSLFWVAGYGNTAYYPSLSDPACSLTIRNSSSSEFTLSVMAYVSILVPFVVGYIWYVWRKMDSKKISPQELAVSDHKY
ncbi:MAG: cytochrome d ubiquinol oxidase subunit II [Prevotella sp.]|nr:cytochrome d ubiquinol oxidase subunit II [Bacteroides sp.]MCM1365962.1 cytochrome d ubiquinol oxidase subunit II [Prevotella sp.]MCM1436617.1 cytochrome d ubiquinol oxidase subunit II [Prevotella sp.]